MASSHREEISRLELLHAAHPEGLIFPHLADAYRRAGRYSQAEDLLNAGLRKHADYSSAHVVLGRLRLDQGKREEAETAFRRVLRLDPQNQIAIEYLADLTAEEGRLDEALRLYRRLHRLSTDQQLAARVAEIERRVGKGEGVSGPVDGRPAGGENGGRDPVVATPGGEDPRGDDPDEVITETMAELYTRQGLHRRAAAVYRQLLVRHPGDARLRRKLLEAEHRDQESPTGATVVQSAPDPPTRTPPPITPQEPPSPPQKPPPTTPQRPPLTPPQTAPQTAPQGTWSAPAPAPPTRTGGGPSIRAELRGILEWQPSPEPEPSEPERDPESAPEPQPEPESKRLPQRAPERWSPSGRAPEHAPRPASDFTDASRVGPRRGPGRAVAAAEEPGSARGRTRALIGLSDMLVGLLEFRDPFFRGSSSLTRLLATSVGEELGLSEDERVDLALAAILRDLGRLALGGKLLPSPRVTPTPEGRRRIERHVDLALNLMEGIDLPRSVRTAVRHHHERWDGAGYPDALGGEDIPRLARILAVVDSFVAMVSPRPYRLPRKVPAAAAELQEESGTRYDPEVVNALIRVLANRDQPHLGFVQRHHLLLVDPDQPGAVVTAAKLCSAGYLAEVAVDTRTARDRLRRVPVAALVVSAAAGADTVAGFIRDLRVDPSFSAIPIVVVDAAGVGLRVRLLESGADVCFPPGVRHAELQGTLGALVRRTLAPGGTRGGARATDEADAPWLALQGDVEDFPLTWLLQVMKYDARTAAIGIRTSQGQGVIYLRHGDAVHARIRDGVTGEEALREMLKWHKGRFTVQPDARTREKTISTSLMHLLLSQAVHQDHADAGIFGAVSAAG